MQPVYLCILVKSQQGTINCCSCFEHARNNHETLILNTSNRDDDSYEVVSSLPSFVNCPYSKKIFLEILEECNTLDETNGFLQAPSSNTSEAAATNQISDNQNKEQNQSSQKNRTLILHQPVAGLTNQPVISLELIDSDNLEICMCSLISEGQIPFPEYNTIDDHICTVCSKIIKKQPTAHRAKLLSRRIFLSNHIVVNRIDTHFLNTYVDTSGEPYTPESVESHTPYPEFENQMDGDKEIIVSVETEKDRQCSNVKEEDVPGKKSPAVSETRGVVSPGDLKSRLEVLQRSSSNEINTDNEITKPTNSLENKNNTSDKNNTSCSSSKKLRSENGCFHCIIL